MGADVVRRATGSCLCGGVSFTIEGPLRDVVVCHCGQCRKTTGSRVEATKARNEHIRFVSDATLAWYPSSPEAARGFCSRCGGNLFWRQTGAEATSIMAGTLDPPTGLRVTRHIFCDDRSDYDEITDGKPCYAGASPEGLD
jgi:hypothetical protein